MGFFISFESSGNGLNNMNYEILRLIRNILFRSFVVGAIISFVFGLLTMIWWTTWMGMAEQWFHADSATLTQLVVKFFMNVRFFLVFIVLTPALAIHWTLRKELDRKR